MSAQDFGYNAIRNDSTKPVDRPDRHRIVYGDLVSV